MTATTTQTIRAVLAMLWAALGAVERATDHTRELAHQHRAGAYTSVVAMLAGTCSATVDEAVTAATGGLPVAGVDVLTFVDAVAGQLERADDLEDLRALVERTTGGAELRASSIQEAGR